MNNALTMELGNIPVAFKDEIEANFHRTAKEKLGFVRNVYNETVIAALHNHFVQHIKREIDLKYMDKETLLRQLSMEGYDLEKEFGKKEPFSTLFSSVLDEASRKLRTHYTSNWSDLDGTIYENRVVTQLTSVVRDIHQPAVKDMKVLYVESKRKEEKSLLERQEHELTLRKKEMEVQQQILRRKEQELEKERLMYQQEMQRMYQERLNKAEFTYDSIHSDDMDVVVPPVPSTGKKKTGNQKNTVVSETEREKDIRDQHARAKKWRDDNLRGTKTGAKSGKSKIEVEDDNDDIVVEPVSKRRRKEMPEPESSEITKIGGKKSTSKSTDPKNRGMAEDTREQIYREQREQEEKMIAARLGKK